MLTKRLNQLPAWVAAGLLLGTMTYAVAEDVVLTTYYASPRMVFQELLTAGGAALATTQGDVAIGTWTSSAATKLYLVQTASAPAFRVDDDANPVGDASPFVIDEEGRVGIGTATPDPSALLDLSATDKGFLMSRVATADRDAIPDPHDRLLIFNPSDRAVQIYEAATQSWRTVFAATGGGGFWSASGAHIFNLNAGNVGINTTTPTQQLDVAGSARIATGYVFDVGEVDASRPGWVAFGTQKDAQGMALAASPDGAVTMLNARGTSNASRIEFTFNGDETQNVFVVRSNGRVGIGTQNPQEELHVIGNVTLMGTVNNRSIPVIVGSHGQRNCYWTTPSSGQETCKRDEYVAGGDAVGTNQWQAYCCSFN